MWRSSEVRELLRNNMLLSRPCPWYHSKLWCPILHTDGEISGSWFGSEIVSIYIAGLGTTALRFLSAAVCIDDRFLPKLLRASSCFPLGWFKNRRYQAPQAAVIMTFCRRLPDLGSECGMMIPDWSILESPGFKPPNGRMPCFYWDSESPRCQSIFWVSWNMKITWIVLWCFTYIYIYMFMHIHIYYIWIHVLTHA
jgi:hypothetical protein